MQQPETSGTVARVVRLLQAMAEIPGDFAIKDLSDRLRLPPSTVHRLLKLLADDGFVERSGSGHSYRPGLELIRIGSLLAGKAEMASIAEPFMRAVVEACNEVCMLVLYAPSTRRVMVVKSVASSHPLRYQVDLFVPHSPLWGATGRSVLAFLPPDTIETVLGETTSPSASGEPLPALNAILDDLARIRERGYALTHGQKIAGAVGMGSPILRHDGSVVGSLCITIPEVRFDPAAEKPLSTLLLRQTRALNRVLGHGHARPPLSAIEARAVLQA